jgi:DNA-binding FadR family transcriptional regulator
VRVLLGVEVARLACLRASDREIDALEENIVAAEAAVRSGNTPLRTELNLEFHRMLARMTHNPLMVTLTNAVTVVTAQVSKGMVPMSDRSVMPLRRRLLAHLRARDTAAAAAEMHDHLLRVQRHYLKHAGSSPGAVAGVAPRARAARTAPVVAARVRAYAALPNQQNFRVPADNPSHSANICW